MPLEKAKMWTNECLSGIYIFLQNYIVQNTFCSPLTAHDYKNNSLRLVYFPRALGRSKSPGKKDIFFEGLRFKKGISAKIIFGFYK